MDPAPDELTARYLVDRKHFSPENARVKARALHPARRDHKTSVFRVDGLSERHIWELGDAHVARARDKPLLARADLFVRQVARVGLRVEAQEPPPRHANISGWPAEKHNWMSVALELAALATLKLRG